MDRQSRARSCRPAPAAAWLAALVTVLAGCSNMPGSNYFGGGAPAPSSAPTVQNLDPDSRGVISYATYQVAVAREGDTITTVAERVGVSPAELAQRNALPEDYRTRAGEVLLLPAGVLPPVETEFAAGEVTTQPLATGPGTAAPAAGTTVAAAPPADNPFRNGQAEPLIDPVRHRVEPGETAYTIARLYGVSVTALASWNGLGPDLALREGQELLIPIVSDANRIAGAGDTQPGQVTPVTPPPSASDPLPEDVIAAADPASPQLGQLRTPAGGRLSPPVNALVTRDYDPANPNGIGYAVPAGTPVRAAGSGEVALISQELGGQGTIVLIRHRDDLMTTYSTLANVTVAKGDPVNAGQVIGVVAPRSRPELQFDVFRGTESIDPRPYLGT
jgi:murein DD-endopeptidase MepM/ murein hydrolase activator NlpD